VSDDGQVAVVNSSMAPGERSRVWLMLGRIHQRATPDRSRNRCAMRPAWVWPFVRQASLI
jgi:hypothetical protein